MKKLNFLIILSLMLTLAWLVLIVPPNMDEAIKYHRLACWAFDGASFSLFQEGCDKYSTSFLGISFYRNYQYIGVLSNFLYAPLYFIWPSIYSHYLFGFLSLLLFSFLLVRALQLPLKSIFIPMLYFPIQYLMIHDHGPINLSLLTYPILICIVRIFIKNGISNLQIFGLLFGACIVTIVGMDEKVFYLYLLPHVLIISFSLALYDQVAAVSIFSANGVGRKALWRFILLSGLLGVTALGFLIVIKADGRSYLAYVIELKNIQAREAPISSSDVLSSLMKFFTAPYAYPHRIFHLSSQFTVFSQLAFAPLLGIAALYIWYGRKKIAVISLVFADVFLICIFMLTKNAWASHHFIFLQIPILILLMYFANESGKKYIIIIFLLIINIIINVYLLSNSSLQGHLRLSKNEMFSFLSQDKVANKSVINFSSFGGYFLQSLYGSKSQIVTWQDLKNIDSGQALLATVKDSSRIFLLNACEDCDLKKMESIFPGSKVELVGPQDPSWRIWQVTP